MGSVGNLTGLKQRLPKEFSQVDPERLAAVTEALDKLVLQLKALLGATSDAGLNELQSGLEAQSASRSQGQQARADAAAACADGRG